MMQLEQLIDCFANEDKEVRQNIDFIEKAFAKHKVLKPKIAKNHFKIISQRISEEVNTELELLSVQKALMFCYEHYVVEQPDLIPPSLRLPIRSQRPFFTESTARLADVGAVIAFAKNNIANSNQYLKALSAVLLLAERCSNFNLEELFGDDKIYVLKDAYRAVIGNGESYLMMDSTSLLLLRQIRGAVRNADHLRQLFKTEYYEGFGLIRTLDDAITSIQMFTQPIFTQTFDGITSDIPASELIALLTNHKVSVSGDNKVSNIRRSWQCDIKNDVKRMTSIAFGSREFDRDAIAELSLQLRRFKHQSGNELRNNREFHECKEALVRLREQCTANCSVICLIIVHYCISLFINGSPWKDKLAVNTIRTYLSTLHSFCRAVFSDAGLLRQAQTQQDALLEISECIEDYLSNRTSDKQNTILIFLQYVNEYVPLRLVDRSLDFCLSKLSKVRTHYMTPQQFDSVLKQLHNEQICWFLGVCYFFGMRHEEAITLHLVDIDNNFIYVTKRYKRKSYAAIRRISLIFMPQTLREQFIQYVKYRLQLSNKLFDASVVEFYLQEALTLLREASGIDSFVVHSLRHCAANNILFLLFIAAFDKSDWRVRYAMFQHELFSENNALELRKQFKMVGHKLSELTSVLNILATQLGHSSALVTAACYLHFLPFISFELNWHSKRPIDSNLMASLLANNSYRYQYLRNGIYDEEKLFKHSCRGVDKIELCNKSNCLSLFTMEITFQSYLNSLYDYLCTDKYNQVFKNIHDVPGLNPSVLRRLLHQPTHLRRIEHISRIDWNAKKIRALKVLHQLLKKHSDIADVRTFRQVLFALDLLGYRDLKATACTPNSIPTKWYEIACKFKCELELKILSIRFTSVASDSFRAQNKTLSDLADICEALIFFIKRTGENYE